MKAQLYYETKYFYIVVNTINSFFSFCWLYENNAVFVLFLQSFLEKAKLSVHNLVQKVGFFGILLCASVSHMESLIIYL